MAKKMNFKSKGAYKRWLAYDKMHVSKKPSKNPVKVKIKGKKHKVAHTKSETAMMRERQRKQGL